MAKVPGENNGASSSGGGAAGRAKDDPSTAFRFYEKKFPEPNDLVMVKIMRIGELGAYTKLLEYSNVEGMILLTELSRKRFRSVAKLVKVGHLDVAMVLRVDKDKGYIDLSKRKVSPEDFTKCVDRYAKSKKVHLTANHVAMKHGVPIQTLNETVVWPLYRKYGHALDALKEAAINPDSVFEGMNVSEEIMKYLVDDLRARLTPTPYKLHACIQVTCLSYEGIDAVKAALLEGKALGIENVTIKLIAAPQYSVVTTSLDKVEGFAELDKVLRAIQGKILSYKGGSYKLLREVTIVGGEEEPKVHEEEESDSDDDEYGEEDDDGVELEVDEEHEAAEAAVEEEQPQDAKK